jgi:hypothetical protein
LAIRLRRFLMTEPTKPPLLDDRRPAGMPAHARHPPAGAHANVFTRQRHRLPSQPGALSQRQRPRRIRHGRPCAARARPQWIYLRLSALRYKP